MPNSGSIPRWRSVRNELIERHGWFGDKLRQSIGDSILGAFGDDEVHKGERLSVWLDQSIGDVARYQLIEGQRVVSDDFADRTADTPGDLVIAEQIGPGQHKV
jgi:hypothetical protein